MYALRPATWVGDCLSSGWGEEAMLIHKKTAPVEKVAALFN